MPSPAFSSEHAPLVCWFWRQAFDEDAIRRELVSMRENGYGGLVLWPGEAPVGYLGPEWMRRVQLVAQVCRTQNLTLWLPDDWQTPSGSGEMARAQNDFSANDTVANDAGANDTGANDTGANDAWSLRFTTENLSREAAAHWQAPNQTPLAAWAVPLENKAARWIEAHDLMAEWDDNPARGVASFNEDVQIVLFFAERSQNDIDRLASETVQRFLQFTHEAYRAHCAEYFGHTIRGFYTAGPLLNQSALDQLPWSPLLPEVFREQHGYELLPRLAALIAPWGEEAAMVRQNFWQTIKVLLQRNWWQPLRAWCEENQLQLALWARLEGEESFNHMVRAYGDCAPGGQAAHRLFVTAQDSSFLTRFTASVAALEKQEPPVALWLENKTPQEQLPLLHRLWQQGIGGHIAPRLEPGQPFAPALPDWNKELSRVHQWLAVSRPAGRVGVLISSRSIWAHYHPRGHRLTRWVWEDYLSATSFLDELHFDFLLLGEDEIKGAALQEGQLLCGRAAIPVDVLVLPGATTLSWDLWRRLKQFVESGGKVICLGLLPRWSEKGRDEELEQAVSQTTMLTVADLYDQKPFDLWDAEESSLGFPITRQNEQGGRWACYQPALNPDRDDARLRVRQMLKDSLPAPLEIQLPHVRFARRETAHGNLFFLANSGPAQDWHLRLRSAQEIEQGKSTLYERQTTKDKAQTLLVWTQFSPDEGGGVGLDLAPGPGEVRWIEWRFENDWEEAPAHLERASFRVESYDGQTARGYALHPGEPRLLVQEKGRFQSHRGPTVVLPPPLLLPDEWQVRRHGPNTWHLTQWFQTASSQLTASPATTPRFSWHSSFEVAKTLQEMSSLQLWAYVGQGRESEVQLLLNGKPASSALPPFLNEPLWSSLEGSWFPLVSLLAGHNALDCLLYESHEEPEVLLVGDFDFDENDSLCAPQNLELSSGSWHEQGLPWFVGGLDYAQLFKAREDWKSCRVFLELSNVREGVGLHLNATFCGTRLCPPWRFDVTETIKPGAANLLHLRVWNSRVPLMASAEPPPAGLLGPVRLVAYPFIEMKT